MTPIVPQKQCSKCKQFKPSTNEYFHKNCGSKDGLYHRCKTCNCHKKPKEQLPDNMKRCAKCKEILLKSEFYADPRTKSDGLYGRCKKCFLSDTKAARDKNPEHSRALALESYYRHHEKRLKLGKEYRDKNPEKWKEKNDKWLKNNPEKARAITYRHLSLKRNAEGSYTSNDLIRIYNQQNGCCAYCHRPILWDIPYDVTVDHIQPLSRGGSNWPDNIALACPKCNASKRNKLLSEWKGYNP